MRGQEKEGEEEEGARQLFVARHLDGVQRGGGRRQRLGEEHRRAVEALGGAQDGPPVEAEEHKVGWGAARRGRVHLQHVVAQQGQRGRQVARRQRQQEAVAVLRREAARPRAHRARRRRQRRRPAPGRAQLQGGVAHAAGKGGDWRGIFSSVRRSAANHRLRRAHFSGASFTCCGLAATRKRSAAEKSAAWSAGAGACACASLVGRNTPRQPRRCRAARHAQQVQHAQGVGARVERRERLRQRSRAPNSRPVQRVFGAFQLLRQLRQIRRRACAQRAYGRKQILWRKSAARHCAQLL